MSGRPCSLAASSQLPSRGTCGAERLEPAGQVLLDGAVRGDVRAAAQQHDVADGHDALPSG